MKHFVLDLETTGTDRFTDDVLQIGMVQVEYSDGLWKPRREFELFLNCQREPDDWGRQNIPHIYEQSKVAPIYSAEDVRAMIRHFMLEECEGDKPMYCQLMGWNIAIFDLLFLERLGYLKPFAKAPDRGDYSYRVYELQGLFQGVMNHTGQTTKELFGTIDFVDKNPERPKHRTTHDAIYDCYENIHRLNGLLKIMRSYY